MRSELNVKAGYPMKCKATLHIVDGKIKKIFMFYGWDDMRIASTLYGFKIPENEVQECGRDLEADLDIETSFWDDDEFEASLSVKFVCQRCKYDNHPYLPSGIYDLANFLTNILNLVDEETIKKALAA